MNNRLRKKSDLPYIFMSIPGICVFTVFFIVPLLFTVRYSFFNWTNFSPDISFTGFNNYKKIFGDKTILGGIKNALIYAIATVFFQSLIALPVSAALNTKFRGRNFFRATFFCPAVLSTLVV